MKQFQLLGAMVLAGSCHAQTFVGDTLQSRAILDAARRFSEHVVEARYDSIAAAYTIDAKVFINGDNIIQGRDAIRAKWVVPDSLPTIFHSIMPEEILVRGDEAIDHGYYEGRTRKPNGTVVPWRGKYVAIWRKVDGRWLMYLDIWNRAPIKD